MKRCFVVAFLNYLVFIVYREFKIAIQGLGMVSNIILSILGNFQVLTKCWTLDPLFIAEMLQKDETNAKPFSNISL